jgi:cytochrome d ubiquinol oxidase subunit II
MKIGVSTMIDILGPYLPQIWLLHMGFFLLYYAISDGLDLGVGIISLFTRGSQERSILMGSIRSSWHGNQSWLVILGGMLFGAFPVFYGIVFSGLYIPVLVMLFGLVARGVAFEFREYAVHKRVWGAAFGWGSLLVSVAQGFALGGVLNGNITVEHGDFTGSHWGWLDLYSLLVTIGVLFGYTMLGSNYLIMKAEGDLQRKCYKIAKGTSLITLIIAIAVHVWTAVKYPHVAQNWASFPSNLLMGGLSLLAAVTYILLLVALWKRHEKSPIFLNALLVVLSFAALSVGLYPKMIPNEFTGGLSVTELAASPRTLMFMLYVSAVAIPIVLVYTSYEYWVYRGKTTAGLDENEG